VKRLSVKVSAPRIMCPCHYSSINVSRGLCVDLSIGYFSSLLERCWLIMIWMMGM
jgi:hypothetical protein